jgi:8-oxo-dGTP diphosphatase
MPDIRLAGCVIQDEHGRVLLLHRNTPRRQQWEIPGGKLNFGEDPRTTAARELREEMGIEVNLERDLGTRSFVEDGHTMIYTWYLATIASGIPRPLERDTHDRCAFLDITNLGGMAHELSPNTKNLVDEIASGRIRL